MKSYKSKKQPEIYETIEEGLGSGAVKRTGNEVKNVGSDLWKQLLGGIGENSTGESVVFELSKLNKPERDSSEKRSAKKEIRKEPGIDYHREYYDSVIRFGERGLNRDAVRENGQIQQIMAEIKKLASSTKLLQVEFGLVAIEEAPSNPGKYYINFFEWMFIMVKQARQKVEDSKSWLDTVKGKGKKKKSYWDKSEEHGTSFTQANERFVATSTG